MLCMLSYLLKNVKTFKKIFFGIIFFMQKIENYAQILIEAFENNSDNFENFLKKFKTFLEHKKEIKLLPNILKKVEFLLENQKKSGKSILILKNKKDLEKFKTKINQIKTEYNIKELEIKENKNIVGGFIIKTKNMIFDNSYKNSLLKLYKKMIQ